MRIYILFFVFGTILLSEGCVRKRFDSPHNILYEDGVPPKYKTIAELISMIGNNAALPIEEHIFIQGWVIADDRSGNLYQQIIIDDGTGAIPILLDAYNLYAFFPVGTRVLVYCKGLQVGKYYRLPQLGFASGSVSSIAAIPFHLWFDFLKVSDSQHQVQAIPVRLSEIEKPRPELYSRLLIIPDVQFRDTQVKLYALAPELSSATSINLIDCEESSIVLRTSAYARFRSAKPPVHKGYITAIYSVYNNTPQLILRDTTDLKMLDIRCF